jgi:hypothetical protein
MGSPLRRTDAFDFDPIATPLRKTLVTRHALRAVFKRNFEKRQARLGGGRCCPVPLPFHKAPATRGGPNWQIRVPTKCSRGCDFLLRGIEKELRGSYDLVAPSEGKRGFAWIIVGLVGLAAAFYFVAWTIS